MTTNDNDNSNVHNNIHLNHFVFSSNFFFLSTSLSKNLLFVADVAASIVVKVYKKHYG